MIPDESDGGGGGLSSTGTRSRRASHAAGREKTRLINVNSPQPEKYGGNRISTAKYSFLSFLPSFLFEQFRRYSNIFFLTIVLLQVQWKLRFIDRNC